MIRVKFASLTYRTESLAENNTSEVIIFLKTLRKLASNLFPSIVDTSRAGRGVLEVSIVCGHKEIAHNIKEMASNVFLVSYTPRIDLSHQIDVRYNGHSAAGFPQMVEIRDPSHSIIVHGNGLKWSIPGENATFIIETGGFALAKDFDIIVTDPNGSPLPVKCYQQKNGSLLVEWTPIRTGNESAYWVQLRKH